MDGWWGHNGDIFGYTTSVFHNYDLDTTIVVVTNSDAPQPDTDPPVVAAPALLHALEALFG
jgi:D-alanyl-D-alanine carboxypeptidase